MLSYKDLQPFYNLQPLHNEGLVYSTSGLAVVICGQYYDQGVAGYATGEGLTVRAPHA